MQTKLTFYNKYSTFANTPKYIEIDENTPEKLGDNIAIFSEYGELSIKFESDDDNAILEIDSSMYETPLLLKPSDEIIKLSEKEDHDSMLAPGYYGVRITTLHKAYKGLYFINSNSVSWEGLVNLRRYLETVMAGLAQNLYIQRMTGQKNVYGDENYSLNKMYSYISSNIVKVINSLENIIKNPITDIRKEYKEQFNTNKQDVKSQRWLCTKGLSKNKNIYIPDVVFEKHCIPTRDILENVYIKQMLQKILDMVLQIESSYQIIYFNSIKKIDDKSELYKAKGIKNEKIKNDKAVSYQFKWDSDKGLSYLKNEIDRIQEQSDFIAGVLINLDKTKSMLLYYINETWLSDIAYSNKYLKVSQKIMKDNRYFQVYDFYLNIVAIEKNDPHSRKPYFPSKKSSELFEYYSVSIIINILRGNAFEWQSGWLADTSITADEKLFNGEITTNSPMIFIKDNLRVELIYEKEVKTNLEVLEYGENDFVRANARHYKPDIMVALYNNTTNELLKAIVIEVKCRLSKYLQSKNGPAGVIEQVRDYYSFGYFDKNIKGKKKVKMTVIDKILIIYPKQSDIIHYDLPDMPITFIQIEANDTTNVSEHYGYDVLKEEIDDCFSKINEKEKDNQ